MDFENLAWRVEDGVGIVTFNRPKVLNAMNARTFTELTQLLDEVERDPGVKALVFTGAGDKAFVAGADIAAMAQMGPVEARRFATATATGPFEAIFFACAMACGKSWSGGSTSSASPISLARAAS